MLGFPWMLNSDNKKMLIPLFRSLKFPEKKLLVREVLLKITEFKTKLALYTFYLNADRKRWRNVLNLFGSIMILSAMQKHFKQLIFKEEAIIARAFDVEISRVQFLKACFIITM